MTRPAVRLVLVLLLIAGVGAAGWQLYVLEKRRLDGLRQQQSLDALREQVLHAIDDSRTAQQAYLAQGQGLDFWEAKFAEATAALTQGLAALRTQANGQPAAVEALDAADRALKVYEGVDRKIRGFVVNNTDLMAADAVYEDGLKTSGVIRSSVEQALAALVGPARTGYDERRMQYIIAGAAAGAGIFVSLLLLPTGRKAEPEVELHAPAGSLHLSERTLRVDPPVIVSPAADSMRGPCRRRRWRRLLRPLPRPLSRAGAPARRRRCQKRPSTPLPRSVPTWLGSRTPTNFATPSAAPRGCSTPLASSCG